MAAKADEFRLCDFSRPMPLVRDEDEWKAIESKGVQAPPPSSSMTKKKVLNIPVCDVLLDEDYDSYVSPSFVPSATNVKHVQRIAEDCDLLSLFLIEDCDLPWLEEFNNRFPSDALSSEDFEAVINAFERATGSSLIIINQQVAWKVMNEKLGYDPTRCYRITPELYKYWVSRREKIGKALCRRYWPAASASDTNPYQVFRVRDRERYRLRRQQKRNDLESFRKMQQLKKDFSKVELILNLIRERENMTETYFKAARQMFEINERRILEVQSTNKPVMRIADLVGYRPELDHIWGSQEVIPNLTENGGSDVGKAADCVETVVSSQLAEEEAEEVLSTSEGGATAVKKVMDGKGRVGKSVDGGEKAGTAAGRRSSGANNERKRQKKVKERLVFYTMNNGVVQMVESEEVKPVSLPPDELLSVSNLNAKVAAQAIQGTLGYSQPSIFGEEVSEPMRLASVASANGAAEAVAPEEVLRVIPDALDGPRYVCAPKWPHFFQSSAQEDLRWERELVRCSDYLDALELQLDAQFQPIVPSKYRLSARVARGGRLVVDRIPVYCAHDYLDGSTEVDLGGRNPGALGPSGNGANIKTYQYPTQLRPLTNTQRASNGALGSCPNPISGAALPVSRPSFPPKANVGVPNTIAMGGATSGGAGDVNSSINGDGQAGSNAGAKRSKELPEVPLSNRKILMNMKKAGKHVSNNYLWASANVANYFSIPPLQPPGRLQLTSEKLKKLQQILAENDSEDEKVTILKHPKADDIDRVQHSRSQVSEQSLTKLAFSV